MVTPASFNGQEFCQSQHVIVVAMGSGRIWKVGGMNGARLTKSAKKDPIAYAAYGCRMLILLLSCEEKSTLRIGRLFQAVTMWCCFLRFLRLRFA